MCTPSEREITESQIGAIPIRRLSQELVTDAGITKELLPQKDRWAWIIVNIHEALILEFISFPPIADQVASTKMVYEPALLLRGGVS